jgi:hypothetical protein
LQISCVNTLHFYSFVSPMSNNHIRRQTQQEMTYRYRSPFSSSTYLPSSRWLDDLDFDRPMFSRPYGNDRNLRDSHRLADGIGEVISAL